MTLLLYVAVGLASVLGQGKGARVVEGQATITATNHLHASVDALLKLPRLTPQSVGEAVGLKLALEDKNAAFAFYLAEAPDGKGIKRVLLRFPQSTAAGSDGMITLDVSPETRVAPEEIIKRFGSTPTLSVSRHGGPTYHCYCVKGAALKFGFSKGKAPKLMKVIIDRIEPCGQ